MSSYLYLSPPESIFRLPPEVNMVKKRSTSCTVITVSNGAIFGGERRPILSYASFVGFVLEALSSAASATLQSPTKFVSGKELVNKR
jgi:hypothetical protein